MCIRDSRWPAPCRRSATRWAPSDIRVSWATAARQPRSLRSISMPPRRFTDCEQQKDGVRA
eukprot:6232934-Pyramimonas_sp.AAC.1